MLWELKVTCVTPAVSLAGKVQLFVADRRAGNSRVSLEFGDCCGRLAARAEGEGEAERDRKVGARGFTSNAAQRSNNEVKSGLAISGNLTSLHFSDEWGTVIPTVRRFDGNHQRYRPTASTLVPRALTTRCPDIFACLPTSFTSHDPSL